MRALFPAGLFLFLVVCLSGCTDINSIFSGWNGGDDGPTVGTLTAEVYAEPERVPGNDHTYVNLVVVNPSSYEYAVLTTYKVTAKVLDLGAFDPSSETDELEADLIGVKQKTLTWELVSPEAPTEFPAQVVIRMKVEKKATFIMPPITFADVDYKISRDIANDPIPAGPKTLTIQDNFVIVSIELNQEPPVITDKVYANLKFSPTVDGVLNITDISIDGGNCDPLDQIAKTVHCEFEVDSSISEKKLIEQRFKLTLEYTISSNLVHTIIIYPGISEETPSGGGTTPTGGAGPTPTTGATKTISACSSVCGPNCEYAMRNGVQYTGCSDSNLNPLFVNAGCSITLSDGSTCSTAPSGGSAVGPTTAPGASLTISACGSSCAASCSYSRRNSIVYSGCSDSNMRSLIVNPGCTITLSDGSVCS